MVAGCGNRLCGPDGQGGTCGTCDDGEECTENGTCIQSMPVAGGCGCTSTLDVLLLAALALLLRRAV